MSFYVVKNKLHQPIARFNSLPLGIFSCFMSSADIFLNQNFRIIPAGISPKCQTVWILIRPDNLSGLIWVKSVSKIISKRHQGTVISVKLKYKTQSAFGTFSTGLSLIFLKKKFNEM